MTQDFQQHINNKTNKSKIKYLDISNNDLAGEANLSEFTALISLNAYNNKFENLTWLETLPSKDKLKKLNCFGNQLKEIDFAWLLSNFPNLESLNIENNPVKTKNLNNLTSEQFSKLIAGIKSKKFRVISWQGTVLMDLLEYAQQLIQQYNTTSQVQAHRVYLQELVQEKQPVAEIQLNNNQIQEKGSSNAYLLVGGLVIFSLAVLAIGYWLGKRKQPKNNIYFDEN